MEQLRVIFSNSVFVNAAGTLYGMSQVVFIFGLVTHMDLWVLVAQDVLAIQEILGTCKVINEYILNMKHT